MSNQGSLPRINYLSPAARSATARDGSSRAEGGATRRATDADRFDRILRAARRSDPAERPDPGRNDHHQRLGADDVDRRMDADHRRAATGTENRRTPSETDGESAGEGSADGADRSGDDGDRAPRTVDGGDAEGAGDDSRSRNAPGPADESPAGALPDEAEGSGGDPTVASAGRTSVADGVPTDGADGSEESIVPATADSEATSTPDPERPTDPVGPSPRATPEPTPTDRSSNDLRADDPSASDSVVADLDLIAGAGAGGDALPVGDGHGDRDAADVNVDGDPSDPLPVPAGDGRGQRSTAQPVDDGEDRTGAIEGLEMTGPVAGQPTGPVTAPADRRVQTGSVSDAGADADGPDMPATDDAGGTILDRGPGTGDRTGGGSTMGRTGSQPAPDQRPAGAAEGADANAAIGRPATGNEQVRLAAEPMAAPTAPATGSTGANPAVVDGAAAQAQNPIPAIGQLTAAEATNAGLEASALAPSEPGEGGEPLWQQIRRALGSVRNLPSGEQQLTIRLRPAELGSVVVRINTGEGGTLVSLVTESAAASNQLNQQRQQLLADLEDSGLSDVNVDINAGSDGDRAQAEESDPDGGPGRASASTSTSTSADQDLSTAADADPIRGYGHRRPRGGSVGLVDVDL